MLRSFKPLLFPLKLIFGLSLLLHLYLRGGVDFDFLTQSERWPLLINLIILQILIFLIATYRWYLLTQGLGLNATLRSCLIHSWIGQLFASFLPSFISSDAVRAYYLTKDGQDTGTVIASVIFDRFISTLTVTCMALSAFFVFFYKAPFAVFFLLLTIFLIFASFICVVVAKRLKSSWARPIQFPLLAIGSALSLITFHLKIFSLLYIAHAFAGEIDPYDWFMLSTIGQFFDSVPVSPANIGFGHYVFKVLYQYTDNSMGAQIYNVYFSSKLLFKISGLVPWLLRRQ